MLPAAPGQTFSLPEEQLQAEEEGDIGSVSSLPAKREASQIKRDRDSTDQSASAAGNAMKVRDALTGTVSPLSCFCMAV